MKTIIKKMKNKNLSNKYQIQEKLKNTEKNKNNNKKNKKIKKTTKPSLNLNNKKAKNKTLKI